MAITPVTNRAGYQPATDEYRQSEGSTSTDAPVMQAGVDTYRAESSPAGTSGAGFSRLAATCLAAGATGCTNDLEVRVFFALIAALCAVGGVLTARLLLPLAKDWYLERRERTQDRLNLRRVEKEIARLYAKERYTHRDTIHYLALPEASTEREMWFAITDPYDSDVLEFDKKYLVPLTAILAEIEWHNLSWNARMSRYGVRHARGVPPQEFLADIVNAKIGRREDREQLRGLAQIYFRISKIVRLSTGIDGARYIQEQWNSLQEHTREAFGKRWPEFPLSFIKLAWRFMVAHQVDLVPRAEAVEKSWNGESAETKRAFWTNLEFDDAQTGPEIPESIPSSYVADWDQKHPDAQIEPGNGYPQGTGEPARALPSPDFFRDDPSRLIPAIPDDLLTAIQTASRVAPAAGEAAEASPPVSTVTGIVEDTGETSGGANVAGAAHVHSATRGTAGRSQRRPGHTQLTSARAAVRTPTLRPVAPPIAGRTTIVR